MCVVIGVKEVADVIMSVDSAKCGDHLMLLDCRPEHEFQASHLVGSASVQEAELLQLKLSMEINSKASSRKLSSTACLLNSCRDTPRSEEQTSEIQSLTRIS